MPVRTKTRSFLQKTERSGESAHSNGIYDARGLTPLASGSDKSHSTHLRRKSSGRTLLRSLSMPRVRFPYTGLGHSRMDSHAGPHSGRRDGEQRGGRHRAIQLDW